MTVTIRPARAADVPAIDALLRTGFSRAAEADLVRRLCIDGDMVLMLVAVDEGDEDAGAGGHAGGHATGEAGGALAGTIAFSRMAVAVAGRAVPAVALAPVATAPGYRGQGVAAALIRAGLERLEAERVLLCFVLGDPDYYGRFGFHADYARNFASRYAGDAFMALPLQGGLMPCGVRGDARHATAFAALAEG